MRPVTLHPAPVTYWRTSVARYATTIECSPAGLRRCYRRNRVDHMSPAEARMATINIYAIEWQQTPRTEVAA